MDGTLLKVEKFEEVNEITLYETQTAQIGQFFLSKTQAAQMADLFANFFKIRAQIYIGCTALVAVFHLGSRELMQHHLHHCEFVEIGIQEGSNDHRAIYSWVAVQKGMGAIEARNYHSMLREH